VLCRATLACCLLLTLALSGCGSTGPAPVEGWSWEGPVPKGYYLVREGDTLSGIAAKRRVSTAKLIRWNGLKPPYKIYAGRLLRVKPPGGGEVASGSRGSSGASSPGRGPRTASAARAAPATASPSVHGSGAHISGVSWAWPLDGPILQGFRAGDRTHQGLRIGCRSGDAVRAAGAGRVVYSGSGLKGYGNLIIVKHNNTYLSAYGFNRRLFVREGDSVKRGQAVAECGQGPQGAYLLHFEVRRDGASANPILYLPPRK
jgi:lipoprotein NlpD